MEPVLIWLCWRHCAEETGPVFMMTLRMTSSRFQLQLTIHSLVRKITSWFAHLTRYIIYIYIYECVHMLVVFDKHYNKKWEPGCYSIMQLKNMMSQLFQSRTSGARDFEFQSIHFGWKALEDLYKWELGWIREYMLVRVPGLKENHIIRNNWTRMNVKPAKIMQVIGFLPRPFLPLLSSLPKLKLLISYNFASQPWKHCQFVTWLCDLFS